jgi:hypothetical protein
VSQRPSSQQSICVYLHEALTSDFEVFEELAGAGVAQAVQRLGNEGLEDRCSIPGRGNDGIFSLRHRVQTCSGYNIASYPMCIGGSFPGGKTAGT